MTGEVFVLVVNWNGNEYTLDCLASLKASKEEIGRVLVVDNGSSDGSVEAIRRDFPEVTLIENRRNLGFGPANNIGMRLFLQEKKYPYLFLLNSDTLITPSALRILVSALGEEGVGAAVPKIYYADGKRLWYAGGRIDWKQGSAIHYGQGKWDGGPFNRRREVSFVTGCALLLKREALEKVGLFDERYFMFGEDVDLSIRLVKAGYRLLYLPEAVIWHKVGGSANRKGEDFIYYHMTRNRLLTMSKHAGWREWLPFVFFFPLLWGWKALSFLIQGKRQVARAMTRGAEDFLKERFGTRGFDPSGGTM
jgi:GT2 family glycosyltransferase